ncbi:type IX secretion system membrane protein PorP/SprF [Maribacter algarum]|uniref:Type IX secretion system membrane protein PorP/SprF n=1 Tax=Maribacter algarum (ex Zhang et al. 2020) TaxID=2578118 RepID=A0A5S3PRG7_9FLAO|nr:type IX secretion system membrane protein PorP/SprF [Maribacter algarum]TMM57312.1 type IX secretion system membrane protein PorP/SprF [Maribacter algarum]
MKTHFKYYILILFFLIGLQSYTQQEAQYTQYMYNTLSINPAYAGSRDGLTLTALYRNQWIGVGGAPETQTLTFDTPLGNLSNSGIGVSIVNDKIGPIQETYFDIDYSYTMLISKKGKLAFGLKAGGHLLNIDFETLNEYSSNDVLIDDNIDNKFSPNFGLGAFYYTNNFYLGLSAPNILETKHFDKSADDTNGFTSLASERINLYLISGYVFQLNPNLKFKPAGLVKLVTGAPLQVDISTNFLIKEKLTLGLAYRWGSGVSAQAAYRIKQSFLLGFAYDWEPSSLGATQFNAGSYELVLRVELFNKRKIVYPRFF